MTSSFGDFDSHLSLHDQAQPGGDFVELLAQLGQSIFSAHTEHAPIVGTPGSDAHDWVHQTTDFTCDVVSQEMILHEFGMNVTVWLQLSKPYMTWRLPTTAFKTARLPAEQELQFALP
jgi:hypothetical protein